MRRFTTLSLLAAAVLCGPVFAQEPENPNGEQKQEEKPKYVPKDKIASPAIRRMSSLVMKLRLRKRNRKISHLQSSSTTRSR